MIIKILLILLILNNLHSSTNYESLKFPSTLFALFLFVNTNFHDALYSVIFGMLDVVMCYIEV